MPKLVEAAINKTLRLYIEAEDKQQELMESHKLRMNKLEVMIDDHEKELDSLKKRVTAVEKESGGSEGS